MPRYAVLTRLCRCPASGSTEGRFIKWQTFSDEHGSVIADVQRIANHPLIHKSIKIYGFIYDVTTGKLVPVPGAIRV